MIKRFAFLLLISCAASHVAWAIERFTVEDIRLQGLQRITDGTVFSYLPLKVGDDLTDQSEARAVRALWRTGFFDDVKLDRQGNILVITFKERPAISSINLDGNKDIKDEDLMKALGQIGLKEGDVFDRSELERVKQELTRQYYSRGKYSVRVDTEVKKLPRNRVDVDIKIAEGDPAKIKHINIVGNTTFSDEDILEGFESKTGDWLSWYTKDDQYAREKLEGDLEKLRSFYLDRGYAEVEVESSNVSISPDKKAIFVTAAITEGDVYKISDVTLTGDFVFGEKIIRSLVVINQGDTFSQKQIERSVDNIKAVMSNVGYAFPKVLPHNDLDKKNNTVHVTIFVDPGKRIYVRHIVFIGNTTTQDEVLRREMRQLESAWFSQSAVDRSKVRLQRLGFFENVDIDTPRVPGTEDQVDVVVKVKETPSGSFQFGLGFSQAQGAIFNLSISQRNFLGTGKQVTASVSTSKAIKSINLSYLNPFYTLDGISRGFNLRFSRFSASQLNIATFDRDQYSFGVTFGFPVTEVDRVRLNANIDHSRIKTNQNTPSNFFDFLCSPNEDRQTCLERNGFNFNIAAGQVAWVHDSRNRFFNPTSGSSQELGIEVAVPGSTSEYFRVNYRGSKFYPIFNWLAVALQGEVGYGDGYRGNGELPFFKRFYAGGVQSVRGYQDNTLGPIDLATGRAIGGAFKTTGSIEFAIPTPFVKSQANTRLAFFTDFGNVYETVSDFDINLMRGSYGISVLWQAPVGPIALSFAKQINDQPTDQTESLQFTFGTGF